MQVNQVRLGAVLSYVSMGLSTLISLIYTPIMLGRLGETEYGVYGAVGPIISYLLLLSMGLGSAYIRYYSQAKVAKDRREMAKLNGMFLVTLSLLGLDWMTALTGAASTVSGVGPGLGEIIGPSGNFASLPDAAKWILSLGMLLGRLEIITVFVLCIPAFWRH